MHPSAAGWLYLRMRIIFCALLFLAGSCRLISEQEKSSKDITGNWLVLYADHQLKNKKQREIYARIQDSVILQRGLKLVRFEGSERFRQLDEPGTNGKWTVSAEGKLYLVNGGEGFNTLEAAVTGFENNELRLTEYIAAEGEAIELVWHLKKISDGDLFSTRSNAWREKPSRPESDQQLKKRLAAMLRYYSDYYELVSKEASYFIGQRVLLPFSYYQHGMGIQSFDATGKFAGLFYDAAQAQKASGYLAATLERLSGKFPYKSNFVEEYAAFMAMMAREVVNVQ